MRLLVRLFAGLILCVFTYLLAAVAGALIPGHVEGTPSGDDVEIVLIAGPIHYDILLPLDAPTQAAFGFVQATDADWLVVGWGSRAFYTQTGDYTDLDPRVIWQAATGDAAVVRFDLAYGAWDQVGLVVPLSTDQFAQLRGEILQLLSRDADGFPRAIPGVGLTKRDVFYEAKGHFSILRTCNVWIGAVLRAVGVPMGAWTPTPYSVTLSRWWFG